MHDVKEIREELLKWLKEHGVKLVIMGDGADEYDQWIVLHIQTANVIGSTPLYDQEQTTARAVMLLSMVLPTTEEVN